MKRIYIASAYTIGDPAVNVKLQIDTAAFLIDKGFAPFVPLLYHFQHMAHPRPYDVWINVDNAYVTVCDALLRLPGESKGADAEVNLAKRHGIPVFYSVEELVEWFNGRE